MSYQWIALSGYAGEFAQAAWLTLQITFLAFALGVAVGLIVVLAGRTRLRLSRLLSSCYIEVIRNTPVLLQVFIVFFGLPSLGIRLNAYEAGVIALGLNGGAYLAEVFRAGMQSVPRGQLEAATILGIGRRQIFVEVVLPQAARAVYPAIINNLIGTLLSTSLLSAIALPELTGAATVINSRTLLYMQTFAITFVIYLAMSNALAMLAAMIGRRLFHPPLVIARKDPLVSLRKLLSRHTRTGNSQERSA